MVDIVLARRGLFPIPQQIEPRTNLFREGAVGPKPARSRCGQRGRKERSSRRAPAFGAFPCTVTVTTVDEEGKDVEQRAFHHTPAGAATTCSGQWRRDARVLGSPPLRTLGSLGPLPFVHFRHPRWFESTSFRCLGSWDTFSLGCQPGSSKSASFVT